MEKITCYLCGADNYAVLFPGNVEETNLTAEHLTARKGNITKEVSYRWVRCSVCGLVYANPAPDMEMLTQLYAKSDQSDYGDETDNIAATYGKYLRKHRELVLNKRRALDVGAGNGFFLRTLLDFGFDSVVGIEPSVIACQNAPSDLRPLLVNKMFNSSDFDSGTFDLVSCFQTIEHVPDPNNLLASIAELLAPDGIVYCVAHNFGSFGVKILGAKHPIINAGHLTLFDDSTISAMFAKYFDVVTVFPVRNKYSVRYWLSLLPLSENLKSGIARYLATFGLDKANLSMSLGNMGVIAKKKANS